MQIVVTLNPLNRSVLNKMCLRTQNIRTVCVLYFIIIKLLEVGIDEFF